MIRDELSIQYSAPNGAKSSVDLTPYSADIYTGKLKIGVAITTYGSKEYVHLGLESLKRHCDPIKTLVFDDCSPQQDKLKALCKQYGVDFATSSNRLGHTVGDLTAFLAGLMWAKSNNLDILVKFSRRFIPLYNWPKKLETLAKKSQYATFSNICQNLNWGFRSECVGMHVPSWTNNEVLNLINTEILTKDATFVESFIHNIAQRISLRPCKKNRQHQIKNPKPAWCSGYEPWDIMGTNRVTKVKNLLWHHSCNELDYFKQAEVYGVSYPLSEYFCDSSKK